jgi:glucokinase
MNTLVVGLDVGATHVRALASRGGERLAEARLAWPAALGAEAELALVIELARDVARRAGAPARAVGLACAALCDSDGRVVSWPNRPSWVGLPLRARLAERLRAPVQVEDDANAAALGEWRLGAGRAYRSGLVVAVGTGVGAGLVLDGRLWRGSNGWAGELGHVIAVPGGPACGCGRRGCVQALASGRALERTARAHDLTRGADVGAAAAGGAAWALEALRECGLQLGLAAANAVTLLDLDAVIVGGALGLSGAPFWPALAQSFDEHVLPVGTRRVALERAQLGDDAALLGAVGLALDALASGRGAEAAA